MHLERRPEHVQAAALKAARANELEARVAELERERAVLRRANEEHTAALAASARELAIKTAEVQVPHTAALPRR